MSGSTILVIVESVAHSALVAGRSIALWVHILDMFGKEHGAKAWSSIVYSIIIGAPLQLTDHGKDGSDKE